MQIGYLSITIGFQFFLFFGYILYGIFRKFPTKEDGLSLMSWLGGLIGILSLGQVGVLILVSGVIPLPDRLPILLLVFVDLFIFVIMTYDVLTQREQIKLEVMKIDS